MVAYAKERLHEVRTLREFISFDDHGHDNGACGIVSPLAAVALIIIIIIIVII